MKERIAIWLIPAFLLMVCTCSEKLEIPPEKHPGTDDWNDLFSYDLSDALFPEKSWIYLNGLLISNGENEIWTNVTYNNFILDLEFQCSEYANSGIIIYCSHIDNWVANSLEIQVGDDFNLVDTIPPESGWCGAVAGHLAPEKKVSNGPDQWNRITISCEDHRVYVLMNEELVIDLDMQIYTSNRYNPSGTRIPPHLTIPLAELPTHGHIGFLGTGEGTEVQFRRIKIREL